MSHGTMNYDSLIREGLVTGRDADAYGAAAAFKLDGRRLGSLDFELDSPCPHEVYLTRKRHEVDVAAYLLARIGYRNVLIESVDADGKPLERPDLDIVVGDSRWGFEVTTAIDEARSRSEHEEHRVTASIRSRLDGDSALRNALGPVQLFVKLESDDQQLGKRAANAIIDELTRFIATREFASGAGAAGEFGASCPVLRERGAWFDVSAGAQYFMVGHGRSVVDRNHRLSTVMQSLNNHRNSARTYRKAESCWLAIQMTDVNEIFRNTIAQIAELRPNIDPFRKVLVTDPKRHVLALTEVCGRVQVELDDSSGPASA